jgi:hypothetical protein
MSFGNSPAEGAEANRRRDRLTAQADAYRARRLAGRKSLLRRVLGRLRPHRQEPGSEPPGSYGTVDDPGH